ncbi:MAG: S26 family signal peptidase [Dysgonamonadaceae bacterium]|nr:S26 family signal peptidase [Dysgonamonadaceae bacterium]
MPYGGRIPKSTLDIPWLNFFPLLFLSNEKISEIQKMLPSKKRFINFSKIRRGDIIVLNDPMNYQYYLVKRCVALAKDTISINSSNVIVNGSTSEIHPFVKKQYTLNYSKSQNKNLDFSSLVDSLGIPYREDRIRKKMSEKIIYLTGQQKKWLEIAVGQEISESDVCGNFNSFIVPYIGYENDDVAYINSYRQYEKKDTENSDSITGKFFNNYYFAIGDNRCFSTDSRLFGSIPENLIVGRVDYILFSISRDKKLRKDRFFRKL